MSGAPQLALSIQQPWAWLLAHGHKDIENRTWFTEVRGPVFLHAGKKFDEAGYAEVSARCRELHIPLPLRGQFDCGGIIGHAHIMGCVAESSSPWFTGPYGFVLTRARSLVFTPLKGKLGFFRVYLPGQLNG